MGRPLSEEAAYARSLGLTLRSVRRMGGMERVKAIPAPQRAILVRQSKNYALKRLKKEL